MIAYFNLIAMDNNKLALQYLRNALQCSNDWSDAVVLSYIRVQHLYNLTANAIDAHGNKEIENQYGYKMAIPHNLKSFKNWQQLLTRYHEDWLNYAIILEKLDKPEDDEYFKLVPQETKAKAIYERLDKFWLCSYDGCMYDDEEREEEKHNVRAVNDISADEVVRSTLLYPNRKIDAFMNSFLNAYHEHRNYKTAFRRLSSFTDKKYIASMYGSNGGYLLMRREGNEWKVLPTNVKLNEKDMSTVWIAMETFKNTEGMAVFEGCGDYEVNSFNIPNPAIKRKAEKTKEDATDEPKTKRRRIYKD